LRGLIKTSPPLTLSRNGIQANKSPPTIQASDAIETKKTPTLGFWHSVHFTGWFSKAGIVLLAQEAQAFAYLRSKTIQLESLIEKI